MICEFANKYCESMVKRGGGVQSLRTKILSKSEIVVELLIDVQESMGANVCNTIAEMTAPKI